MATTASLTMKSVTASRSSRTLSCTWTSPLRRQRTICAKTADYGAVAETIVAMVTGEAFDLIETLSVRMAEKILADFAVVNAVEVTIHKPKAPIQVPFGDVSITVFRSRAAAQ